MTQNHHHYSLLRSKTFRYSLFTCALVQFLLTSCHQLFQNKISKNTEEEYSSVFDLFYEEEVITQLLPPEQIFASDNMYSDSIEISWTPVKGAASYRLERAVLSDPTKEEPEDGDFSLIPASKASLVSSSFITDTKFVDLILENPSYSNTEYSYRYFYRVSAENTIKKYESSSFLITEKSALFAPPSNVTADAGESSEKISIKWTPVDGATTYKLYRTTDINGYNSMLLASVSAAIKSFDDIVAPSEQGVDFYYTVTAVNDIGQESVKSAQALGFALKSGAPGRVEGVKIVENEGRGDTSDSITVSWDEMIVVGAEVHYAVYRTSSVDSTYNLVKADTDKTTFTDTKSLKPNVYYYYQVLAFTGEGEDLIKGPLSLSSAVDENPAEGYLLSPPSEVAVSKEGDKCTIRFAAAIGEEGSPLDSKLSDDYKTFTYKIFSGEKMDLVDTEETFTLGAKSDGYYSVSLPAKLFYKVQTVNGEKSSRFSEIVAPAPSAATGITATKRAKIDGYTDSEEMANSSGVYPVKVTWTEPAGGAPGGYYVYRSTTPDSGYRKITDEPVMDTSYIDMNDVGKPSIYYYYKVMSLNSLSQGANLSGYAMGYGAITHNQYMREYNKTIQRSQKKLTVMHKPNATDKLGKETIDGDLCGTLSYDAHMDGLGAEIIMHYESYADYKVPGSDEYLFHITGNTNTKANMSSNGNMFGTVTCLDDGMYPGTVVYDNVEIKGGAAGGGFYVITPEGFDAKNVSYTVGNEGW